MRALAEIQADIAATFRKLDELAKERDVVREARRVGIIADFDAGMSRDEIAAKWAVDYGYVSGVLHKAVPRRTEDYRRGKDLTGARRRHYLAALRGGASSKLARQIAQAVTT